MEKFTKGEHVMVIRLIIVFVLYVDIVVANTSDSLTRSRVVETLASIKNVVLFYGLSIVF